MCHSHIFLRSIIHQTAILRSIVDCQTPYLCFFLQSPPPQASQFQSHSLHHNHPSVPQELQRVLHISPIRDPTLKLPVLRFIAPNTLIMPLHFRNLILFFAFHLCCDLFDILVHHGSIDTLL